LRPISNHSGNQGMRDARRVLDSRRTMPAATTGANVAAAQATPLVRVASGGKK
jgi:hypothetical protein